MKLETLYVVWKGHCAYCGTKLKLDHDLRGKRHGPTCDHFIPLSAGGGRGKRNHVLSCQPCNQQKGAFDPRTFVKVWHQLDNKALQAFLADLDGHSAKKGISVRLRALLTRKPPPKKKLN